MDRAGKVSNGEKREIIIFSDEPGWHTDQLQIGLNLSGIKTRILNLSSIDIFIDCAKDNFVKKIFLRILAVVLLEVLREEPWSKLLVGWQFCINWNFLEFLL